MDRRTFIGSVATTLLGPPLAARAQQPALPAIGYLSGAAIPTVGAAFRQGLSEMGYVEGQNVVIEGRSAEGVYERLPALAAELARRRVEVIVAVGGSAPALQPRRRLPRFRSSFSPVAIRFVRVS
jgi:putative ABC transport system substrate-binding protein